MSTPHAPNKDQMIDALKPFAEIGEWLFARQVPDDDPVVEVNHMNGVRTVLTRGHFKAAHRVAQALASAPAQAVPDGWKLVPVGRATTAMVLAASHAHQAPFASYSDLWQAMLAAAPTAPDNPLNDLVEALAKNRK